mgnify:FL=1
MLSSRFSIASSLSNICFSTLLMSSVGTKGSGVGGGHLLSSGRSGWPGNSGRGYDAFSFPFSALILVNPYRQLLLHYKIMVSF